MGDIPSLDLASGDVAARLVGLLPRAASPRVADLAGQASDGGPPIPALWLTVVLALAAALAWTYWLAQMG